MKIQIYAAELPPMRLQYTGHVSLAVSRDQYTALIGGSSCDVIFLFKNK